MCQVSACPFPSNPPVGPPSFKHTRIHMCATLLSRPNQIDCSVECRWVRTVCNPKEKLQRCQHRASICCASIDQEVQQVCFRTQAEFDGQRMSEAGTTDNHKAVAGKRPPSTVNVHSRHRSGREELDGTGVVGSDLWVVHQTHRSKACALQRVCCLCFVTLHYHMPLFVISPCQTDTCDDRSTCACSVSDISRRRWLISCRTNAQHVTATFNVCQFQDVQVALSCMHRLGPCNPVACSKVRSVVSA